MSKMESYTRPLLTIAVPTYNGSSTIKNMLDVLLPQLDPNNIEIIVSDNCSTDDTPAIIKKYQERYKFIKYKRNEQNLGADGNFLQCMQMAKGKYTMLISDDDIVTEIGVSRIIDFLNKYSDVSLAFLYTVGFKDKYIDISHCHKYKKQSKEITHDICTTDKKEFFDYIRRQWGFTSSFLWNTDRCKSIENPEQYFGTYWLQSYIHILCSDNKNDKLGLISGPVIAAGEYGIVNNYDLAEVEGIYYRKMLDYAIQKAGYDRKQLYDFWKWKVCYLGSRSIILEKSSGIMITSKKKLFKIMYRYPYAWLHLFPSFVIPNAICRLGIKMLRKRQGRQYLSYINRPTT